MTATGAFTFEHPGVGVAAGLAWVALVLIAARRRPAVPRATLGLAGTGAMLLAVAAGGLAWLQPIGGPVAVLVDLSPSTRGASYRDAEALRRRVAELLGATPHELRFFADGEGTLDPGAAARLPDLPSSRTVLPDVAGTRAVVLFSDGRLAASPAALPPVYAVIDPGLERAEDAAVTSLDVAADSLGVGVRNTAGAGTSRALVYRGLAGAEAPVAVAPGSFTLSASPPAPGATQVSAAFAPGDPWPENDALRAYVPPPPVAERWWVGAAAPGGEWRLVAPDALPTDAAAYLSPGAVVLDNIPAGALDAARQSALLRYVRDLGGGLLVLGGDRAFAAGGYAGTALDALSPLASTPPEPTTHWVLLADGSGSMNRPAGPGGRTRWDYAAGAVAGAGRQLPPADRLSVGSFADALRWWSRDRTAGETLATKLPPDDVRPRGATNLDAALRAVLAGTDEKLPTHLLVATDAQAEITGPAEELAAAFKARDVRVHVLFIGEPADARALPALRAMVNTTGGTLRAESLPEQWAAGLVELLRAARPSHVRRDATSVSFLGPLRSLPPVNVPLWNRTWPKDRADALADAQADGSRLTMAARWNLGEGAVLAAAFPPPADAVGPLVEAIQRTARDPRFAVSVDRGPTLRVTVDAVEGGTYLNGEPLTLELVDVGGGATPAAGRSAAARPIPQVAPGRYVLAIDAPPTSPAIARVRHRGVTLTTAAVAGRYAREFDAVGADRPALADLARRTGGAVVEPGVTRRLDLRRPRRAVPLLSWLAVAGAALVAAGLVRWRIGS